MTPEQKARLSRLLSLIATYGVKTDGDGQLSTEGHTADYETFEYEHIDSADVLLFAQAITTLQQEKAALELERDVLRGIQPEFPPRPPHGEGLPRYGIRHNGPTQPLAVPMADGYWTPWHLAEQAALEADVVDWMLVADGVKHDWRCVGYFDANGHPCQRCRAEQAEATSRRLREALELARAIMSNEMPYWRTNFGAAADSIDAALAGEA